VRKLAVGLALAATCAAAGPDELSAGRLYQACNSNRDTEQAACRFYVLGVVQGASLVDGMAPGEDGARTPRPRKQLCPPDGILQSQLVDVFRKSMNTLLQAHPEDATTPAQSIVLAAMHTEFPCP
jgi:hypothetical protein